MFTRSQKLRPHEQQILSWEKSKDGAIILLLILKCFAHFHSNLFSTKTTEVETLCFRACIPWTNKKVVDVVVWLWSYHIIIFKMIGKKELNHRLFEQLFITIKASLSRFHSNPNRGLATIIDFLNRSKLNASFHEVLLCDD